MNDPYANRGESSAILAHPRLTDYTPIARAMVKQILTIRGSNFGVDKNKLVVTIDDQGSDFEWHNAQVIDIANDGFSIKVKAFVRKRHGATGDRKKPRAVGELQITVTNKDIGGPDPDPTPAPVNVTEFPLYDEE